MSEAVLNQQEAPAEVSQPSPRLEGPGPLLKRAREASRMTQAEIAEKLRLNVQRINEIENNDFSQMKAVIYAQGYLRAYADMVKAPVESVLEAFRTLEWTQNKHQNLQSEKADQWVRTSLSLERRGKASNLWLFAMMGLAALVIALLVWDYWPSSTETSTALIDNSVPTPMMNTANSMAVPAEIPLIAATPAQETVDDNPFVKPLKKTKHRSKSSTTANSISANDKAVHP